jgi:hypothetical protein
MVGLIGKFLSHTTYYRMAVCCGIEIYQIGYVQIPDLFTVF